MAGTMRKIEALVQVNGHCLLDFLGTLECGDDLECGDRTEKSKDRYVIWTTFDVKGTFSPKVNGYAPQVTFDRFLEIYEIIQKESLKTIEMNDVYETKLEIKGF